MTLPRQPLAVILAGLVLAMLTACGSKDDDNRVRPEGVKAYYEFQDVDEVSAPLQLAAAGVVRITSVNGSGTGFYVTNSGVMLTNAHVLGPDNCPASGCYVTVHHGLQRGGDYQSFEVFAEPIAVNMDLDSSAYRLFHTDEQGRRTTTAVNPPQVLPMTSAGSPDLVGQKLYVVGHPHGGLKKVVSGVGTVAQKRWFELDLMVLGGNSGSPVLNEFGEVVGQIHRSTNSSTRLTGESYENRAYGTSSQALSEFLGLTSLGLQTDVTPAAPRLDLLTDLSAVLSDLEPATESTTVDTAELFDAIANNADLYLAAKQLPAGQALTGVEGHPMVTAFAHRCDAALAEAKTLPAGMFADDLARRVLGRCVPQASWLDCSDDRADYEHCVQGDDVMAWHNRTVQAVNRFTDLNQQPPYRTLASLVYSSHMGNDDAQQQVLSTLDAYVEMHQLQPNFELASARLTYAATWDDTVVNGVDLAAMVKNYTDHPRWRDEPLYVARGLMTLLRRDESGAVIIPSQGINLLLQMLGDKHLTLGDRLTLERWFFESGLVK